MFRLFINNEEYTDYIVSNPEISGQFVEDTIIGNTPSLALNLTLDNTDKVFDNLLDFPFVIKDEEKAIGSFFVVEAPERMTNQLYLEMYDSMSLTDIRYESKLKYPTTLRDQLDEMSRLLNMPIDYAAIPQDMVTRTVNMYDNTLSIRNHLSMIAEAYACNVYAKETGGLIFRKVSSETKHHITENDVEQFDKEMLEEFTISKVMFDDTVLLLEAGTNEKNTLYLTQDNMYIDNQKTVDYIYSVINGLSIYSVQDLKIAAVNDARLGDIIEFDGYFRYMVLDFKTTYLNGEYNIQEMNGRINTKNLETMQTTVPSDVKIKRLKVLVDQNETSLKILAQKQEGLNNKISEIEVTLDGINMKVENITEDIYKFEVGSGNIFENCKNYLQKDKTETGIKQKNDMTLGINADYLKGKDIVIALDVDVRKGIIGSLGNYIGAEFDVFYKDGTRKTYSTRWYLGQYMMQYLIQTDIFSHEERIWTHFKIDDKEVTSTSNLRMIIAFDCEYAQASNPKVEFGTTPTGFYYDMDAIRDNITTIQKNYTEISTKVDELTLKAVSMEEQITTINGKMTNVTTRLQSAEIKLQPTNILMAVNEKIGADGKLYTTKFVLDKAGVHISGGGLDISNNAGTKVLYADTEGNLTINKLTAVDGNFTGTITGSVITGTTISGNTITGGSINGATITTDKDLRIGNNIYFNSNQTSTTAALNLIEFTKTAYIRRLTLPSGISSLKIYSDGAAGVRSDYNGFMADISVSLGEQASMSVQSSSASLNSFSLYKNSTYSQYQISVSSDIRKKENIKDIDLTELLNVANVKSFNYKISDRETVGVIAQDFVGTPFENLILSKDKDGFYSVDYNVLLMAVIQYIQKEICTRRNLYESKSN